MCYYVRISYCTEEFSFINRNLIFKDIVISIVYETSFIPDMGM